MCLNETVALGDTLEHLFKAPGLGKKLSGGADTPAQIHPMF